MTQTRILIVEDERIVARDLQYRLEKMGYLVSGIASSGEDAIQAASDCVPDLILMDIVLDGQMDGVEAARQIRLTRNIPILFVTSFSDDQFVERAKTTEASGYILKPVDERELSIAIDMALYKAHAESRLREEELRFRIVADFAYEWEMWVGPEGEWLYNSPSCERITGYTREEFLRDPSLMTRIVHPEDLKDFTQFLEFSMHSRDVEQIDFRIINRWGEERWIGRHCRPVVTSDGEWLGRRVSHVDVTERKRLVEELQQALANVKVLKGLLPICSICKKIRDDSGYWNQLESYLKEHADARFSHSICPDCMKAHYREFMDPEE